MDVIGDVFSNTSVISFSYLTVVLLLFGAFIIAMIEFLLLYNWCRNREKVMVEEYGSLANLLKEKQLYESEIEQMKNYAERNKNELLQLEGERELQEKIRSEILDLQQQRVAIEQKLDDKKQELASAAECILKKEKAEVEIKSLEEKLQNLQEKKGEVNVIELQLEERKKALLEYTQRIAENEIKLSTLNGKITQLEQKLQDLESHIEFLLEKKAKIQADIVPLEDIYNQIERARKDRDDLFEDIKTLKEREKKLRDYLGEYEDQESAVDNKYKGLCYGDVREFEKFSEPQTLSLNETERLSELKRNLAKSGIYFSERVIYSFHTSLKINDISPLVVLAGVSGTGKTLLPIKYAEFMGIHCLPISVQPRWDSPQDLFGFYNYIEKKYKETELIKMLVRMDDYYFKDININKYTDRLLLVLLDEMNLARIEYYFSDLLSKLELRKNVNEDNLHLATIELSMGPNCPSNLSRLWIDRNVLFVGTMNEDESTQTLSDKVLDRANVLRFGRPVSRNQYVEPTNNISSDRYLPFSAWKKLWKEVNPNSGWYKQSKEWLDAINDSISIIGRPFGYRVEDAILSYLANYPGVDTNYKNAFADQLEQKIIPKLRGLDMSDIESVNCLSNLDVIIQETEDTELTESFKKCQENARHRGMFQWHGVKRTNE
ncbi:MAG: hypothetical protein RBU23_09510 [Candidatus Auribacterota bacterium]|jgi:hypothetical protein|nr:hypothetical protein [Candidatus Auribacterota bacterium]